MTPDELRAIREKSAPTQGAFARALGYQDADTYRKYESGARPIPLLLQRLAVMIDRHGLPEDWRNLERHIKADAPKPM